MAVLDAFEIETNDKPTASIIWLHGLGSNGHDFEPIVPELSIPPDLGIRFIFPHAPKKVVTINGGLIMPSWYDILTHEIDRKVDVKQLESSANDVATFIHREIENGIKSERILIAGFSQGGAVGYQLSLSYPKPLGGLIALSSYFATKDSIDYHESNYNLPVFIGHGTEDTIVPEALGQQAHSILANRDYDADYYTYSMDHSVCMEEVNDIADWIKKRLL